VCQYPLAAGEVINYPTHIRITAKVKYQIVWVNSFEADADGTGECDNTAKIIFLKSKMSKSRTLKTLIHEILHAMEYEHGIDMSHKVIYELEEPILRLLKLNRWI